MQAAIQRNFSGGELAPAHHARADTTTFQTGLRTCVNFFIRKEGGVSNRPGLVYVATVKNPADTDTRLVRFEDETPGSSILIEAGTSYFRFYKNGVAVNVASTGAWSGATNYLKGDVASVGGVEYYCILDHVNVTPPNATYWHPQVGTILEVPTPSGYVLTGARFDQDGDTITITLNTQLPLELIHAGDNQWTTNVVATTPSIAAPLNPVLTPGVAGTRTFSYVIVAAASDTYETSLASAAVSSALADVPTEDDPHVLGWDLVAGAVEYYVYLDPFGNGVYGFVGTADTNVFNDVGFVPDFEKTPSIARDIFPSSTDYPAVSATYQQRRWFGSTKRTPDQIDASRLGFPANFGITSPLQDDDAIRLRIRGKKRNAVRWLVGLKRLIVGTDGGVWTLGRPEEDVAPGNTPTNQVTYAGVDDQEPVEVGESVIYVQARGSTVRDLNFDREVGFFGRDLTVFSNHLFEGKTMARLEFMQTPHSIVWAVRSDGVLLGLTYLPEQDQWGWHRHTTGVSDTIEDVCVVPESAEDVVYVIVKRTVAGITSRFIETFSARFIETFDTDAIFMDSAVSYSGAPVSMVSGLTHLEGAVVAVVADGAVLYDGDPAGSGAANWVVKGGSVGLGTGTYSNVHVGLRYVADLETLDLDVEGSDVRARKKRVGGLKIIVEASSRTLKAGPEATTLRAYNQKDWQPASDAHTGILEMNITSRYDHAGRVLIRQDQPLPLTVLGVIPLVETGGT